MISSKDFEKAIELIKKSSNILITTHTRPDGDACGCIAALSEIITAMNKKVQPLLLSPLPKWYGFLFDKKPTVLESGCKLDLMKNKTKSKYDLVIIVDTNSYNQLPDFEGFLRQNDKPVLVIDHHVTGDGLGDVELVDTSAAAAGLIVFELFKYVEWPISPKVAEALFVAIATDTGWFQFTNTDSRVFRACADLIDYGVNEAQLYRSLYENMSPQRFGLMTDMLSSLKLHFDGRYAEQHLTQADFKRNGASHQDTENLIDQCRKIAGLEAAALFVELKSGKIKCSLRSTGTIDVRSIAQSFGGGGHIMAAGVELPGPMDNAKKIIYQQLEEQFRQIDLK